MPRTHPALRWLVLASLAAGLSLRIALHRWDPSVMFSLVFTMFGIAFTARPKATDKNADDPVARGIVTGIVLLVCIVLVVSGWLTVQTFAPMVVAVIALAWALVLRRFTVLFVVPLLALLPIAYWQVAALRSGGERDRLLGVAPDSIARVEFRARHESRSFVVTDRGARAFIAERLHRAVPLYPNHEGIADEWQMRVVLADGASRDLLIGHGNRSRSYAWLAFTDVNTYALDMRLEDILARAFAAREGQPPATTDAHACEASVRAACAMTPLCNPGGGRVNLFIPDDFGGPGSVSFFERAEDCADSYLRRQCVAGGFACVAGEPPHCVDLDPQRYGASRAVAVPIACVGAFRERR